MILNTNPIGEAHNVLDAKIATYQAMWSQISDAPKSNWWNVITNWATRREHLIKAVGFLLGVLDDAISSINGFVDLPGPDKKATVLRVLGEVYDFVVKEIMPIWLRPFSGLVRKFVIEVCASILIDWIVKKYKDGLWDRRTDTKIFAS